MRIILIFAIIFIVLIGIVQFRPGLHGPDEENYYNVAKSLSFERNLMFNNEFESSRYPMTVTPTYHIVEHHQVGVSFIWMFIFDFLKTFGITDERILIVAINLSEYFLSILALIFIFKICIKFFDRRTVFLSILAVLFGTNLFAYMTCFVGAAHMSNLFFTCGFLLFYFNTRRKREGADWLILGGLLGLMLMTRRDASVYFVFPIIDLLRYIKDKRFRPFLLYGLIFVLGVLFTFSPLLLFWKIIFGKIFWPFAEADYLTGNKFLDVLFSPDRGFLFFAPLLGACFFIGLRHLYKKEKILAFSSALILLLLVYGTGKMKFSWWAGASFGARFFLSFMPLFILSVAACFKRLTLKSQIIITVISSFWTFFLLALYIFDKELQSYREIIKVFNFGLFYEILRSMYGLLKYVILSHFFLKSVFLIFIFAIIFLCWRFFRKIRISQALLKRISVYLLGGVVIYINMVLIECYFNDKKVIAELKREGFYKDAVFGDFNKADIAGCYMEFASIEIREGRIGPAINAAKRAMRLYPPYKEWCFESLYEMGNKFPEEFKAEFIKNSDAFDCLGLSLAFYEKGDLDNAKYYFKEAVRLKPDIIEAAKEQKDRYLSDGLDKASNFYK